MNGATVCVSANVLGDTTRAPCSELMVTVLTAELALAGDECVHASSHCRLTTGCSLSAARGHRYSGLLIEVATAIEGCRT
jgi:hypothetical protein